MHSRKYSSKGIVLAKTNYSEADRILIVYTRDFGKIHLIAKGVRKPKSRKRGSLEVFSLINFSANKGKGLDFLTEVETIESYRKIRKDLKKLSLAYYFMEVIGRITKEEEENKKLFDLISGYMVKIRKTKSLRQLRKKFVEEVLVELGYWPKERPLDHPDGYLEEVVERQINSFRVGKRLVG